MKTLLLIAQLMSGDIAMLEVPAGDCLKVIKTIELMGSVEIEFSDRSSVAIGAYCLSKKDDNKISGDLS